MRRNLLPLLWLVTACAVPEDGTVAPGGSPPPGDEQGSPVTGTVRSAGGPVSPVQSFGGSDGADVRGTSSTTPSGVYAPVGTEPSSESMRGASVLEPEAAPGANSGSGVMPSPEASAAPSPSSSPGPSINPSPAPGPSPIPSPTPSPAPSPAPGPAPSPEPPGSGDTPNAVDIGNPTGTGPKSGRLTLYLADASIDGAKHFYVRPVALRFLGPSLDQRIELSPSIGAVDLLQYREGVKFPLYDGPVLEGAYTDVHVILDFSDPATLVQADNTSSSVLVPPLLDFLSPLVGSPESSPALAGKFALNIIETATADATLHIDLGRALLPISVGLPPDLLGLAYGHDFWLIPLADGFLSDTVGALKGIGLGLLVKTACVYKNAVPATPETADCLHAAGRAVTKNSSFRIDYLHPGSYAIRLYLSQTLYLDVPALGTVTAGVLNILSM